MVHNLLSGPLWTLKDPGKQNNLTVVTTEHISPQKILDLEVYIMIKSVNHGHLTYLVPAIPINFPTAFDPPLPCREKSMVPRLQSMAGLSVFGR